jgi:hypothetical protein
MRIPTWIRPRSASSPELAEQLEHAAAALAAATAAIAPAQASFDDDPSDSAAKALRAARDAESLAREHHARAERLLTAAKEREAEKQRAADEARVAEIDAQLARAAALALAAALEADETEALLHVADLRAQRQQVADRLSDLGRERYALMLKIGSTTPSIHGGEWQHRTTLLSSDRVVASLTDVLRTLERGTPKHAALSALIQTMGGDGRAARTA